MGKIIKITQKTIIFIAIVIILIIAIIWTGFMGILKNKTITHIDLDNQMLIGECFNIKLSSGEIISRFERNEFYSDVWYSITIKGVGNIDTFKKNNNIKYYTNKRLLLWRNSYKPIGTNMNCFYNDDKVILSLYTFSKDYDERISDIFVDLSK